MFSFGVLYLLDAVIHDFVVEKLPFLLTKPFPAVKQPKQHNPIRHKWL
jgi:hypothetical protein